MLCVTVKSPSMNNPSPANVNPKYSPTPTASTVIPVTRTSFFCVLGGAFLRAILHGIASVSPLMLTRQLTHVAPVWHLVVRRLT